MRERRELLVWEGGNWNWVWLGVKRMKIQCNVCEAAEAKVLCCGIALFLVWWVCVEGRFSALWNQLDVLNMWERVLGSGKFDHE